VDDCVCVGDGLHAVLNPRRRTAPYVAPLDAHVEPPLVLTKEPFATANPEAGTWPVMPSSGAFHLTATLEENAIEKNRLAVASSVHVEGSTNW
jgi:hypothetical protein